jgi:hypothetical protein
VTALEQLALALACDVRDNPAGAHRVLAGLDRGDLERVAWLLAERVPLDVPISQLARPGRR